MIRNFFRFFDFIFTPDEKTLWLPSAVLSGLKIIKKEKVDLIYSTGDPFSAFFIGYFLKKISRIPLVIDFRDEWVEGYLGKYYASKYKWQIKLESLMERKLIAYADKVISVTPAIIDNFKKKYPEYLEKFISIPNGFDEDDFKGDLSSDNKEFVILHSGKIYSLRRPDFLINIFKEIAEENHEFKKCAKLIFIGEVALDCQKIVNKNQSKNIIFTGFMPKGEVIKSLKNSIICLLILDFAQEAQRVYTAKIFEYLGANKFILAIAPRNSQAAKLIFQANAGIVVENKRELKGILLDLFNKWKSGKLYLQTNKNFINQFTRENLTKKLALTFNELLKRNN
ncbi:MAG: glycosyltransferase [Armatimonadetes bacterium]|nr:glycosyltransferase [Armatimonadota bacterium]